MGSYPNPPPAPRFTHTPETLKKDTQRIIESSRKLDDTLAAEITPESATFENVVKPLSEDENYMSLEVAILGFYQYVSTDKALRDASSESEKELEVSNHTSGRRMFIWLISRITP
jgi:metallopeptidase MepB